jgi:hypothetical protein
MSCVWYVYCEDCDDDHAVGNRMLDEARKLIAHRNEIAAMADFTPAVTLEFIGEVRVGTRWFAEHKDHRLVPRNEFRHFDGDCGEWFVCKGCGENLSCTLPKGHEAGAHGRRAKGS